MDDFNNSEPVNFTDNSLVMHIFNGLIQNITFDRSTAFVTVTYDDCIRCNKREQTVTLVVTRTTQITDERGNSIFSRDLKTGMIINASFSSAMTRSIPPQAQAFRINVVSRPAQGSVTVGRILTKDRDNRFITTISDGNLSSVIRFNLSPDTVFLDPLGRRISFSRLTPGMRVRVRHASFMTASIPPQTTAFEIQIIR